MEMVVKWRSENHAVWARALAPRLRDERGCSGGGVCARNAEAATAKRQRWRWEVWRIPTVAFSASSSCGTSPEAPCATMSCTPTQRYALSHLSDVSREEGDGNQLLGKSTERRN